MAASAAASGGTSIAKAPLAAPGAQLTGDTSSDSTIPGDDGIGIDSGCWHDLEYWRLELAAGDEAKITGGGIDPGINFEIGFFPPGTTDANIAKATSVKNGFPKRNAVLVDAVVPGTYVFVAGPNCYNGVDGPFEFTVAVTHGAAPVMTTVELSANGPLTATVRGPGSVAITDPRLVLRLVGTWRGKTHELGSSSPRNGVARFIASLPRGTVVRLQVVGGGPGYAPVKSPVAARAAS